MSLLVARHTSCNPSEQAGERVRQSSAASRHPEATCFSVFLSMAAAILLPIAGGSFLPSISFETFDDALFAGSWRPHGIPSLA